MDPTLRNKYFREDPGKLSCNVISIMDSDPEDETPQLLDKRQNLTEGLLLLPYDLIAYLERAAVHAELGYPEFTAGDAYRALLLTDEVRDESFEYHEQAREALRNRCADGMPAILQEQGQGTARDVDLSGGVVQTGERGGDDHNAALLQVAHTAAILCYQKLAISLLLCGCLKSAYDFCMRGLIIAPEDEDLLFKKEQIQALARRRLKVDEVDINDLPDQGLVRREVYPWNHHEPNRFSAETLDFLNAELSAVSSKSEVKVTELPTLVEALGDAEGSTFTATNKQLGR